MARKAKKDTGASARGGLPLPERPVMASNVKPKVTPKRGKGMQRAIAGQWEGEEWAQPAIAGRLRFIKRAGFQYQNLRDVYAEAGYILEGQETFDHYWALYERDPVAGRIIDMPVKTTWRETPELVEGEVGSVPPATAAKMPKDTAAPPGTLPRAATANLEGLTHRLGEGPQVKRKDTKFEAAWEVLAHRLSIWKHFERVDRLQRIGRYAVMLIGARGGDDRALMEPLEKLHGPEDIMYLASYPEKYALIDTWEIDPANPRFGLPVLYKLMLSSGVTEFPSKQVVVHHSRIIHVAEDLLLDDVFGRPVLKRCLNALADMLKVTASTGEAYWQLAARVLTAKIDPEMEMPVGGITALGENLEAMTHGLRRQFVGHGVELGYLQTTPPNPQDTLNAFKSILSAASGIPMKILFSTDRSSGMGAQADSTQDERTYFGMISERQTQYAEPLLLRAFVDRMIQLGVLPAPSDGYSVLWPQLFELTEKDQAEADNQRSMAAKNLTPIGGSPLDLVEVDDDGHVWLLPSSQQKRDAGEGSTDDLIPERDKTQAGEGKGKENTAGGESPFDAQDNQQGSANPPAHVAGEGVLNKRVGNKEARGLRKALNRLAEALGRQPATVTVNTPPVNVQVDAPPPQNLTVAPRIDVTVPPRRPLAAGKVTMEKDPVTGELRARMHGQQGTEVTLKRTAEGVMEGEIKSQQEAP